MDAPVETNLHLGVPEAGLHELESRVHALEEAVGRLEDTQALEERIVARVTDRLPQVKVDPDRDTGVLEERLLARLADRVPTAAQAPPPDGDVGRDDAPLIWGGTWASWLLVDMVREARLLVRMIFDRRYQMAWSTRLVALVLLPAILTSHWWLPLGWLPAVGGLLVSAVNLVLAFALYKALSREVQRYKERAQRDWRSS